MPLFVNALRCLVCVLKPQKVWMDKAFCKNCLFENVCIDLRLRRIEAQLESDIFF